MIENNSDNTQIKNADEMMYEAGFEKVDEYTSEDKVTYQCCTENDYWIVRFFKSYGGIAKYLVAHSHFFETDGEWKKSGCNSRYGTAQSNSSGIARTWLVIEKENGIWIILN